MKRLKPNLYLNGMLNKFWSSEDQSKLPLAVKRQIVAYAVMDGEQIKLCFERRTYTETQDIDPKEINMDFAYTLYSVYAKTPSGDVIKPFDNQKLPDALLAAIMGSVDNPDLVQWLIKPTE